MAYSVVSTETFEQELDDVVRYLVEELHSPSSARELLDELRKASEMISENPLLKAVSRKPALHSASLRELFVKNFVMVYKVTGNTVYLMHLFHQRQDYEAIL